MTNEVHLSGTLTRAPEQRILPSGDAVVTFRLRVPRGEADRPGADWVDCAVWAGRLRRTVLRWRVGEAVDLEGALRRRVYRSPAGIVPVLEIEVRKAVRLAAEVSRAGPA